MSVERKELTLDLSDLEIEDLAAGGPALKLESLSMGQGITELGASLGVYSCTCCFIA
jgi:hypothetical protein